MGLFLYDLFIFLNFVAFCIAVLDKDRFGKMRKAFWISVLAFGGCGSGLACMLVRHRTKSGEAFAACVIGVVQALLVWWIRSFFG